MKLLVIQTAFTGDAILATAVAEELHAALPDAEMDILVRKGNESLFEDHPFIRKTFVWNKKQKKWSAWLDVLRAIRSEKYDRVVNLQRFASTGLLTALSGARIRSGFDKNPLHLFFNHRVPHELKKGLHEIERNHALIADLTGSAVAKPKLYPTQVHYQQIRALTDTAFVCMAPGSVWFTKMWPEERWMELVRLHSTNYPDQRIYLLGSPAEHALCERIRSGSGCGNVENLSGKLPLLASAALMQKASMNYVNDSAPMHLASSVNAPVTAIYCSTTPAFGFGPLSEKSTTIEIVETLSCRPCGLHGKSACPEGHFRCGYGISAENVIR